MALARHIGNCSAIAFRPAGAYIFPFQPNHLHRFAATALPGIIFAPLARAILAAPAENSIGVFNGQQMHLNERRAAIAFSSFCGNIIAGAIVLAVADVIVFCFVRRDNHVGSDKQEQHTHGRDQHLLHIHLQL
jgi:hypothetical protein